MFVTQLSLQIKHCVGLDGCYFAAVCTTFTMKRSKRTEDCEKKESDCNRYSVLGFRKIEGDLLLSGSN